MTRNIIKLTSRIQKLFPVNIDTVSVRYHKPYHLRLEIIMDSVLLNTSKLFKLKMMGFPHIFVDPIKNNKILISGDIFEK